jgi:acyl carrier protein
VNDIDRAAVMGELKKLLQSTLSLGKRGDALNAESPLVGSIPELDSMAVVTVITAIEERFGFTVADDDISAETFATLGSLADFVDEKLRD